MKTLLQKTFSPKLTEIKREWYIIDAEGKTLGKIATKIADMLRGKNKTTFSNHIDCGDYVIVINASKVIMTGKKELQKEYYSHTRFPGGLKTITAKELREKKPEKLIEFAVAGMIDHNKLKKHILKKLKVYGGSEHNHSAQNPKKIEL